MNKRNGIIGACIFLAAGSIWASSFRSKQEGEVTKEISPFYGKIEASITVTGTVYPQNRLEIKPPISGRIDKILVAEGQVVKVGDILALMSSTDRAALLDAAKLQGGDSYKNWEEVYRSTPLLAPIEGEVIVKAVTPGQTVSPSDVVIVLSDRLIVQAQVDETDIGKVKLGQEAMISLDSYPDIKVRAKVDHVYYESKVVNNVTIYQVDIVPEKVPDVFRSGMSANVQIIQESKDHLLVVPIEVLQQKNGQSFVYLSQGHDQKPLSKEIQTGLSDDVNIEIVSGLTLQDKVIEQVGHYDLPKKTKTGTNPFMPRLRGR